MDDHKNLRLAQNAVTTRWPKVLFAYRDNEEVGPRILTRIAKETGLKPEDL